MSNRVSPSVRLCIITAVCFCALSTGAGATGTGLHAVTVGQSGCDFTSIQEAIDRSLGAVLIRIVDPIHTESAIRVTKNVVITGGGAEVTILQAHADVQEAIDRLFWVEDTGTLILDGLTLRHGHPSECPKGGGAILNRGTTWLLNCVLRDNLGQCGGAVLNEATLYAFDTMFLDNRATSGLTQDGWPGRGSGGALKSAEGYVFLSGCTIAGNSAYMRGGGIKACCTGSMHLANCTISGNTSREAGGGIHGRGILTIEHCTISGNSTNERVAIRHGGVRASGIFVDGLTTIVASIVAGNEGQDVAIGDRATIVGDVTCLVGDGGVEGWLGGDPLLSDLGDHGGPTWTHALLEGSPAIDAAVGQVAAIDQRGVLRPQGDACDLGAVERNESSED